MDRRLLRLLVVALVAAAPLAAAASPDEHQVLFVEKRAKFEGAGAAIEGETRSFRFLVAQDNVTRLDYVLEWSETRDRSGLSGPDAFTLSVKDPAGAAAGTPVRGSAGRLHFPVTPVNAMPEERSVPDGALDETLEASTGREGKGEWRAYVTLDDVGDPSGATVDEGNDFVLTVYITYYEAVPMRVVSLPAASAAVAPPEARWAMALLGLAALAVTLGGVLTVRLLRRRGPGVSPVGDNSPPSGK